MFAASDTDWAPWFAVRSDDKKQARLDVISHLLDAIPYEAPPREKIKLPKRQKANNYKGGPDVIRAAFGSNCPLIRKSFGADLQKSVAV